MKKLLFTMLTMLLPMVGVAEVSENSPLTSVNNNEASYSAQDAPTDTGEAPVEININATNFPDENFRNYLLEQKYGKDGVLTEEEIEGIISINVRQKEITNLKGIEYFTALKYLYCDKNQLTVLDVSKNTELTNLSCSNNQLTALDVSKNTELTTLYCFNNQLTTLDVSRNTALIKLSCENNQLSALDVSNNTALTSLPCDNNQLTALDVSKNPALISLACSENQLTALDVSKNTALSWLECYRNNIKGETMTALINSLPNNNNSEINYFCAIYIPTKETNILTKSQVAAVKAKGWIPQYYDSGWKEYEGSDDEGGEDPTPVEISINVTNFPDENFRNYLLGKDYGKDGVLTEEEIEGITSINVDKKEIRSLKGIEYFTALTTLSCDKNQLTALDVSNNTALKNLSCYSNQLAALDVSNNTALAWLSCYSNQLAALDVSKNTALIYLDCFSNQLTTLDVSNNTALKYLTCYNNQLSILDVSKNTALTSLSCSQNQLTALDVSKNTVLTYLDCSYNQLTALDVSKNTTLPELWCFRNNIEGGAMTALINSLPNNYSSEDYYFRAIGNPTNETNILTKPQAAAIKAKGWIPQYFDYDSDWTEYEGSDDEDGENPAVEKCEKPTIFYANGELTFGCATEDVEFHWTITNSTDSSGNGSKVSFTPKTTVSVYASKDGYKDSDTATLDINGSGGLKGDVNNNGGIDIGDAVTIVNFLVGKTATLSRKLETGTDGGEPLREKEPQ